MKRFTKLTALLAVAAAAPAIVSPTLVSSAHAQDAGKEFPDVPLGHWAYPALQKLAAAGILEGYPPTGDYRGQRPMTRYEFAVAIARVLQRIPDATRGEIFDPTTINNRLSALEARPVPDVTRQQVQDLIDALRREFADELARLDGRVTALENRLGIVENRIAAPQRTVIAASFLHRRGFANYINGAGNGRTFLRPDLAIGTDGFDPSDGGNPTGGGRAFTANNSGPNASSYDVRVNNRTFSYTDFEVRLTDRVSDRLSVNAALRSLGSNFEDPWVGDTNGGLYVREAFVSANLNNFRALGVRGLSATLGRQRTKIASGLLYDNDLSPTDQLRYDANIGPFALTGFIGSQNNVGLGTGFFGRNDPYGTQGSNFFLNPVSTGSAVQDVRNQRVVGFSNTGVVPTDDTESLGRASVNLFRLAGQPVQLGYSRLLDGYRNQGAESVDLTLPLFNRTIGIELVRSLRLANNISTENIDRPIAGIASANLLRTSIIDLNAAYGQADDSFEFLAASAANPYARSYGEALFDRPIFLGAPMINGSGVAGEPGFLTAKRGFDISGTVRLPIAFLRRVPLDFRYFNADSGRFVSPAGGGLVRRNLGEVYSLGTSFNLTPGVDLEVKGGIYNPTGNADTVRYVRIGANVGF